MGGFFYMYVTAIWGSICESKEEEMECSAFIFRSQVSDEETETHLLPWVFCSSWYFCNRKAVDREVAERVFPKVWRYRKMVSMIHLCQPSENWSNFVLDACSGYLHFLYRLQYNFIGTSISTIYWNSETFPCLPVCCAKHAVSVTHFILLSQHLNIRSDLGIFGYPDSIKSFKDNKLPFHFLVGSNF